MSGSASFASDFLKDSNRGITEVPTSAPAATTGRRVENGAPGHTTSDGLVVSQDEKDRFPLVDPSYQFGTLIHPDNWHSLGPGHYGQCYIYGDVGTVSVVGFVPGEEGEMVKLRYHLPKDADLRDHAKPCSDGAEFTLPRARVAKLRKNWLAAEAKRYWREEEVEAIAKGEPRGPQSLKFQDGRKIKVGDVIRTDKLPNRNAAYKLVYHPVGHWASDGGWTPNYYSANVGTHFSPDQFEHGEFSIKGFLKEDKTDKTYKWALVQYSDTKGRYEHAPIDGYYMVSVHDLKDAETPGVISKVGRALNGLKRGVVGGY